MAFILIRAISWFANLLTLLLILRALFSWFVDDPYSPIGKLYMFCIKLTEPIVAPCRNLLSRWNTGMFDFSVLLAFFLIQIAETVLIRIVHLFMF